MINAIRKEDHDKHVLAEMDYAKHLWLEKEIKSVANVTSGDLRELLDIAGGFALRAAVQTYPLEQANTALLQLKAGHLRGAKVLKIN
jgi:propanol-preferring alcohol dehydrogenase